MKKYIFICIVFAISNIGYTQNKKSDKGITMIKISSNNSNIQSRTTSSNDYSSGKSRIGYGMGIERLTELKTERVYLNTQLALNSLGYKNVRTTYLNVPITINFFVGKNKLFYLGAGMYGGYLLTGKYKDVTNGWVKLKLGEDATDNRSRFDYGMAYTIAYTFAEGFPYLQLNLMSGIKNLIPKDRQASGAKNKLNSIELSLRVPLNVMNKLTK